MMTTALYFIGGLVIAFQIFCNGALCAEVEIKRAEEGRSFADVWDETVKESQGTKAGDILMKLYYFIPSIFACISRCRQKKALLSRDN